MSKTHWKKRTLTKFIFVKIEYMGKTWLEFYREDLIVSEEFYSNAFIEKHILSNVK